MSSSAQSRRRSLCLYGVAALLALTALGLALVRPPPAVGHGLWASYFANPHFVPPARRRVLSRRLDICADGNIESSRQVDYSVRWEGFLLVDRPGWYAFLLDSDDGSELFLDGRRVVANGGQHVRRQRQGGLQLGAGAHALRIDYFQTIGDAFLRVRWRPPGEDSWQPLPLDRLLPVAPEQFNHKASDDATHLRQSLGGLALAALLAALVLLLLGLWSHPPSWWRRRRWQELLARGWAFDAACLLACLPFYLHTIAVRSAREPFLVGDGPYYANVVISLLRDGDLDQRNQTRQSIFTQPSPATRIDMYRSNISLGSRGEWYPKHSILMPLLSLPAYAAGGGWGLLVFNLLMLLGLLVAMRRLAALVAGPGAAMAAALLLGLAPLFVHYAYSYCADILGALLVVAGLVLAGRQRWLAAGVVLGLAAWAKLPNLLALPAAALLAGTPRRFHQLVRLAAGAGVILLLLGGLNWYRFGAPWLSSYSRVLVIEGGRLALADHTQAFNRPLLEGARWQLFDLRHGLLATAPLALLGLGGLPALWRRRRCLAAAVAGFFLVSFLFYCRYDYLASSTFSNRFLMPALALLAAPLAVLLERLIASKKFTPQLQKQLRG